MEGLFGELCFGKGCRQLYLILSNFPHLVLETVHTQSLPVLLGPVFTRKTNRTIGSTGQLESSTKDYFNLGLASSILEEKQTNRTKMGMHWILILPGVQC